MAPVRKTVRQECVAKGLAARSETNSRILAEIATAAGEEASAAIKEVLPLIGPATQLDAFVHRLGPSERREGTYFADQHPDETLRLLDRLIGPSPSHVPYGFGKLLRSILRAKPGLANSMAFQRLRAVA